MTEKEKGDLPSRGNFLVRDGLLSEEQDKWELTVEKRAYDILSCD
jgi:hypothetical protein